MTKMAVMGVGAVGSYIGAFFSKQGYDIVLIDMWGDHVKEMQTNGISVIGCQGPFNTPVNAFHLTDAMQMNEKFDVIFFAVKSYDTEWAAYFAKRLLKDDGVIVSNQNCMNDSLIASIMGYQRTVGCVMSSIQVALWNPGEVERGGLTGKERDYVIFRIGELNGIKTPRAEQLAEYFSCIDLSMATSNIWGERWAKLTVNASTNTITAMSGLGAEKAAEYTNARKIQVEIAKESCQVGSALNYMVESVIGFPAEKWTQADQGDVFEELESVFLPGSGSKYKSSGDWKSSMAQDVHKNRKTEINFMNGFISDQGVKAEVRTPINSAVTEIIRQIDLGERLPSPDNFDEVLKLSGNI
jgi:2-dehydropantoate 2-reductase